MGSILFIIPHTQLSFGTIYISKTRNEKLNTMVQYIIKVEE